ncbi:MAG: hypothetical protein C0467_19290 [Planctomycetaceae bacterium]|nr:hypothetical protein [Planctomycetaceae bacterium]
MNAPETPFGVSANRTPNTVPEITMIPRTLLIAALGVTGCSQSLPESPPPTPVVVATPTPSITTTQTVEPIAAQPPKPPEPPTVFDYPTDLGGKAVQKAVTPSLGKPLTTEKFGAVPKPRTPSDRVLDPDLVTKAKYVPPPVMPAKPAEVKPTPPAERVPFDLGLLADAIPTKPTFPVSAGITERARDVKLPPALPILGRPFNERVSLDDPTAELGNMGIVSPTIRVIVVPTGFLRVTLPDPFELGEQVKPRVPPAAEPGLAPVVVNPQRVK